MPQMESRWKIEMRTSSLWDCGLVMYSTQS